MIDWNIFSRIKKWFKQDRVFLFDRNNLIDIYYDLSPLMNASKLQWMRSDSWKECDEYIEFWQLVRNEVELGLIRGVKGSHVTDELTSMQVWFIKQALLKGKISKAKKMLDAKKSESLSNKV